MAAAAATSHLLPEDVVVDILLRLPVKSLKRFRGISKSWGSMIQSPEFISAHYSCSKNKVRYLLKHESYREQKTWLSFLFHETLDVVATFDIPVSFAAQPVACIGIVACCNGIVCLWDNADGILLWNLATAEFKILPMYPLEYPPGYDSATVDTVAFGYDSRRDDYKVVRIHSFWVGDFWFDNPNFPRGNGVTLYDLTTDSWRNFNGTLNVEMLVNNEAKNQVCLNGFCHFWAMVDNEESLLSFDLGKEVFITTPFPNGDFGKVDRELRCSCLTYFLEINGSVGGLYCHDFYVIDKLYDVWVLGELGVKNSWTKLFTVGPISGVYWPLVAGNNGEFFFLKDAPAPLIGDLVVCYQHPSKQETTTLQVLGASLQIAMYTESLVSLRG